MSQKHTCTKEKEISEIRDKAIKTDTDVNWIKNEMIKMSTKIDMMHDVFMQGEGKISQLNKAVYGNGVPGLIGEVSAIKDDIKKLHNDKAEIIGGIKLLKILTAVLGSSTFLMVISSIWPLIMSIL